MQTTFGSSETGAEEAEADGRDRDGKQDWRDGRRTSSGRDGGRGRGGRGDGEGELASAAALQGGAALLHAAIASQLLSIEPRLGRAPCPTRRPLTSLPADRRKSGGRGGRGGGDKQGGGSISDDLIKLVRCALCAVLLLSAASLTGRSLPCCAQPAPRAGLPAWRPSTPERLFLTPLLCASTQVELIKKRSFEPAIVFSFSRR